MFHLEPQQGFDHARIAAAPRQTRRVLRLGQITLLASVLIVVLAFYLQVPLTFGIHTHPPRWLFVLAHIGGVIGGVCAGYLFAYIAASRVWLAAAAAALVCYGFTFSAIAWAVPSMTVYVAASPMKIEAQVHGGSSTSRRRSLSCQHSVSFGPWYAPGGRVCVAMPAPKAMTGYILHMQGTGNAWATQITRIDAVYAGTS